VRKLIFLRGIPASGKSTYAKSLLHKETHIARVNKDNIREMISKKGDSVHKIFDKKSILNMLYMGTQKDSPSLIEDIQGELAITFSGHNWNRLLKTQKAKSFGPREKITIDAQSIMIKCLVRAKLNMIIDDTNYNSEHFGRIKRLCPDYTFEVVDMHQEYGITVEECIKRNKKRDKSVPDVAIYGMAKRYGVTAQKTKNTQKPFECEEKYIVCDLDGSLCDVEHRLSFIRGAGKKDWNGFFGAMDKDTVRPVVKELIDLTYPGYPVVLVTGRPEKYREMTESWLVNNNIRYDALYMRRDEDKRSDILIKQEILDLYLNRNNIEMSIDDRPCVIRGVWRKNKIKVIDVGDGKEF